MSSFMLYSAPDAPGRARKAQEILQFRIDRLGLDIEEMRWDHIGLGAVHERRTPRTYAGEPNEVVLRFAARVAVPGGALAGRGRAQHRLPRSAWEDVPVAGP